MSLTDTINNTNTQKENIKTVATQIDNKLVELGGERATNLADVANKIENAVTQRKKVAIIELGDSNIFKHDYSGYNETNKKTFKVATLNLDFVPSKVYVQNYIKTDYSFEDDTGLGLCEQNKSYIVRCNAGNSTYNFKTDRNDLMLTSNMYRDNAHCVFDFIVPRVICIE